MKYAEIFQLRMRHPYYESGACPDLRITPLGETENLLRGHRIILQTRPDRLVLLGELKANGELLLPPETGLKFRFALNPARERFYQITELPAPSLGQLHYTNQGASSPETDTYHLVQSLETEPEFRAWAVVEIEVDANFNFPPQSRNHYDVQFQSLHAPWNIYLTTSLADDYLRIEGDEDIHFYTTPLADLIDPQLPYTLLPQLDLAQRWNGSDENGLGLDFAVDSNGLQSQGPASAATLYAATSVAPIDGISWRFRLSLPFAPDATNRFSACFLASHPDPSNADLTAYILQIGESGPNALRLIRFDAVNGQQEIGRSAGTWTGNIDLEIAVTHEAGTWVVEAATTGQALVEEIRVDDSQLQPGAHLIFVCDYDDPSRANQFAITSPEIRIPLGDAADIERKKTVANTLAELFPDKNQFLFASAGPVEIRESPRKGISLKNGSSTLIEHMGNPSPDDNGTQFIHI